MWIIVTLSAVALGMVAFHRPWRPASQPDLGWVTERWLSEHRARNAGDSR